MLVMPRKYYRVCCNCGKIMRARMLTDVIYNGKKEKGCPYCGIAENDTESKQVISEYQAKMLFMVADMVGKEFYMSPELKKKYNEYYDAYDIPKRLRVL